MSVSPVAATTDRFNPETRLYIDGRLRDSSTGKTADNINPATEEVLGVCTDASSDDMEEAIAAARRAFDTTDWSTNREFRQHCLRQLHNALQEEKEDMRAELVAEAGAPVSSTYIAQLDWPLADAVRWPRSSSRNSNGSECSIRTPRWACPTTEWSSRNRWGGWAITPWNFPFEIISNKMGQILATGNTMVLKPAIETPWSALRWGRIIAEKTDIPAGVVNIVPASDNDIAQRLVTDPRIDMISFTGSTAVGRLIQRLSGDTMKRTLLELGGKSAYIVLDDADMSVALPGCMGALIHSGQGCALATRMLVPASSTTRPSRWRPRHSPQSGAGIRPIRPTSVARWCRPGNATG
ncbi:aldehyde dehydrogenase family protein [Mycobacterium xenopi 4042]|uniref:Aldehyde dehydrogenase family protein n=1 Tax=Mycobacterium xenopi 4042 TaxID=1299334 RepID=X7ZY49_MYCXE|nr:aldehyde dehydrogenase family protein [Mycobacterium xenopi 4042]